MDKSNENGESEDESLTSDNPEDYVDCAAAIPECQPNRDPWEEYKDYPEEKVWCPRPDIDETWVPLFMFMRSVLTCAQERKGVPNVEAMENSCTGYAEQYITDVIHESDFLPEVAMRKLASTDFPDELVKRWTASDVTLFSKGLSTFGKKFDSIRAKLLPHKTTKDLVEFYYTWKRSKETKGVIASRARRFLRRRSKSSNLIIGSPAITGMVTRGQLAAVENSNKTPGPVRTTRKDVFTPIKRKRRNPKQTRSSAVKV